MVNKKSSLFIAAIAALFCFVSITWFSCRKDATLQRCEGVVCENGGHCALDTISTLPACVCPTGFEGPSCATASVGKYLGTWNMRQIITGSDTAIFIRDTSYYVVFLVKTATPTTFFINNFANNPYYNQILCSMDSTNTNHFFIDTLSTEHLLFTNAKLLYGSGSLSLKDTITGSFAIRLLTPSSNYVYDTVNFRLTPDK